MKFELDEYYFNRAGDKVKYVGEVYGGRYFRDQNDDLYMLSKDRKWHPFEIGNTQTHELDILGKWEITDDSDRVYVTEYGEYYARIEDGKIVFTRDGNFLHMSEGAINQVQKILIKPGWGSIYDGVTNKPVEKSKGVETMKYRIQKRNVTSDHARFVIEKCISSCAPERWREINLLDRFYSSIEQAEADLLAAIEADKLQEQKAKILAEENRYLAKKIYE